jgi:hypothetical protein
MARQFKSNGNGPTKDNTPETKAKKQWQYYLNTNPKEGESEMIGAFEVRGGFTKKGDEEKPYVVLSGFSKQHGPISIFLQHNVNALMDALEAAGYLK